jgi:hypothetical protein
MARKKWKLVTVAVSGALLGYTAWRLSAYFLLFTSLPVLIILAVLALEIAVVWGD